MTEADVVTNMVDHDVNTWKCVDYKNQSDTHFYVNKGENHAL